MSETMEMVSYDEWKNFALSVIHRADTEVFIFERDKYYACYCVVGEDVATRHVLKGGDSEAALLADYSYWISRKAPINFSKQLFDSIKVNVPYRGASVVTEIRPHVINESQSCFDQIIHTVSSGTSKVLQVFRASTDNVHDVMFYLSGQGADINLDLFDGYTNTTDLKNTWTASDTTNTDISLEESITQEGTGKALRIKISGTSSVGDTITRSFSPALDLSATDSISFGYKAADANESWLCRLYDGSSWTESSFQASSTNYLEYYLLVSSFDTGIDWSNIEQIQFVVESASGSGFSGGTYYVTNSNGLTVAPGTTTNTVCGNNTTSTRYNLLTSAFDCTWTRVEISSPSILLESYINTAMTEITLIQGISYRITLRNYNSGNTTTYGCRLFYITSAGTKVDFSGAEATYTTTTSTSHLDYTFSLVAQSANVPVGAKIGIRVRAISTAGARLYWGSDLNGYPMGILNITTSTNYSYIDNIKASGPPGSVEASLYDFGSSMPASGTALPTPLAYDSDYLPIETLLPQAQFTQFHLHYASHNTPETTVSGLIIGNYYGLSLSYPSTGSYRVYGCSKSEYINGQNYLIENNTLTPISGSLCFGVFSKVPAYVTNFSISFDADPGHSNLILFIEDEEEYEFSDWIIHESLNNNTSRTYDLARETALLSVRDNKAFKVLYRDDAASSSATEFTCNIKWIFEPITTWG